MHGAFSLEIRDLPISLRVWGAEPHYTLNYFGPVERFEEVQRLFPEAAMVNVTSPRHY
jgi:hypothetical protein